MFLIEYADGLFVNAEEIVHLYVRKLQVGFTIKGVDDVFIVDKDKEVHFINHVQGCNGGLDSPETYYHKIRSES